MQSNKETAISAMMDNHIVLYEFLRCMTGDLIGEGSFRYVFDNPFNKNEVIKIDMSETNQNTVEFDLYQTVEKIPELEKWFAPIVGMSPCGRVLIMKKADMNRSINDYPKEIPSFMFDVKKGNFGFIGKRFVCIDYGYNLLYVTGEKYRMVKANWI